jgi:hypothetical protein
MKYLIEIIFLILFLTNNGMSSDTTITNNDSSFLSNPKFLLIGDISFGLGANEISPHKIEAAMNFAAILSKKYILIPSQIRDSVADLLTKKNTPPRLDIIADSLKADKILFFNIGRIFNMLRIEITSVDRLNPDKNNSGEGFAEIRYMKESSDKPLYDPAILKATQAAFAVAENDSNMYANEEGSFRVIPSPTLVIGGLEYLDDPKYLPKWELFELSELTSYDAVESIFEEAINSDKYVIYDIPTRDTIYTLFNLFVIENDNPPSVHEIEALDKFNVNKYISGKFIRLNNYAKIQLSLYDIISAKLKHVKTVEASLEKDDIDKYRAVLKELTRKLLDIKTDKKKE